MSRGSEHFKNILVGSGAYYLSSWALPFLSWGWLHVTEGITYRGDLAIAVLSPIVRSLPAALLAAGVGALTTRLVGSAHPTRWALVPAFLYAVFEFTAHEWVAVPAFSERFGQVFGAAFVGAACMAGAGIAAARSSTRVAA